jgi:hypothetical protein
MGTTSVFANGPFEFTDANGNQVSIPLTGLQFDSSGNLVVATTGPNAWAPWTGYSGDEKALVLGLLAQIAAQQLIIPAPAPSPKAAIVFKAADPGSAGNNVTVSIKVTPSADPALAAFDITVSETETYNGLSAATIEATLGTDVKPAAAPGLVVVVSGGTNATRLPQAGTVNLGGGAPGTPSNYTLNDATSKPVFTLRAKKPGADGDLTKVTIANVQTKTFDLSMTWTKKATGVTLGTLASKAADLAYEVIIQTPPSGIYSVPADSSSSPVPLSGGADGTSATAATATIFASQ